MPTILESRVDLINDRMKFSCISGDNPAIVTDYIPPLGNNEGYMPLEVFLISLSACLGGSVAPFLRRMKKNVSGLSISARGIRKDEHPTGFSKIILKISVTSDDIESADMDKVIKLSEDTYCPLLSMIRSNVEVEINHEIIAV